MEPAPGSAHPEVRVRLRGVHGPSDPFGGGVGDWWLVRQPVLGRGRGAELVNSSLDGHLHKLIQSNYNSVKTKGKLPAK